MVSPDWHMILCDTHLQRPMRIRCSGYAGVKGNDPAGRLGGKQPTQVVCVSGRSKVWMSSRQSMRAQHQGHHTIARLEERGKHTQKSCDLRSTLKGRDSAIIGIVRPTTGTTVQSSFEGTTSSERRGGARTHKGSPERFGCHHHLN